MAFTNAWNESTPLGTEDADQIDNYFRKHRLDLGERLESMFYGFNAGDNSAPENVYGCKRLKLYPQTSPSAVANYGWIYGKDVDNVIQLHWLPESGEGSERRLTRGNGILNVIAGDYAANSIDEDDIRLGRNAYLTGRNNADDGDVNICKVNASDEVEFGADLALGSTDGTDGQEITDIKNPSGNYSATNKKYVDDLIPALGTRVTDDSASNAIVVDEIYKVTSDGFITVKASTTDKTLQILVDSDNTPSAVMFSQRVTNYDVAGTVPIKKDWYFQLLNGSAAVTAYWTPLDTDDSGECQKQ